MLINFLFNKIVAMLCCVVLCSQFLLAQPTTNAPSTTANAPPLQNNIGNVAISTTANYTTPTPTNNGSLNATKPEVLSSGFIDVVKNGQVNASARLIRLFVGEPNKFSIPLSIYGGVSANNFSNNNTTLAATNKSNAHLVNNFINPMSGLINISFDDIVFAHKKSKVVTKFGFSYQAGIRVLTGNKVGLANNPTTGTPINFFNSFGSAGLFFQTGAWERNNSKNVGIFWLSARYIQSYTKASQLQEIMPTLKTDGMYNGYALGWGIEIDKLINLKIILYKYFKQPEIEFSQAIYQFSFNYSLK
jgi:hypothetical protein